MFPSLLRTDQKKIQHFNLVVFDADRVNDIATYDDPIQFPVGIPYVLVNGEIAVDEEVCTGILAGQAIP